MSAPSSSSSGDASTASRVLDELEEHGVALSSTIRGGDGHALLAAALHLHTLLRRPGTRCISIADDEVAAGARPLPSVPSGWAADADGFCFQYTVPPSLLAPPAAKPTRLLIKAIRLDRTLVVHACIKSMSGGSDAPSVVETVELPVDDYVDATALAASSSTPAGSTLDFRALLGTRLAALIALYDRVVLGKLVDGSGASSSSPAQQAQPTYPSTTPWQPNTGPGTRPGYPSIPGEEQPPEGFDPLRVYAPPRGGGGQFRGDLDPLAVGPGGNLMGPGNFPFPGARGGLTGPRMPGMAPRFDPYGPVPGMGQPDFDELPPPGPGGPFGGLGGPRRGGGPGRGNDFGHGFGGGFGGGFGRGF